MESPEPVLSSAIVLDQSLFRQPPIITDLSSKFRKQRRIEIDQFVEFAKETFRRYEESNQRIDTFRLRLQSESYARLGLATQWTLNALKLGATDLTFRSELPIISIPLEEVFRSKNVVRLRLKMCKIDQLQVTECPSLKSLALKELVIKPDALFDIISCCPSVEDLSLSDIGCGDLKTDGEDDDDYDHDKYHEHAKYATPPPPAIILHKLRSLKLLCTCELQFHIRALFLDDLSFKLPNLKHLSLAVTPFLCETLEEMRIISSSSLETLNIHIYYTRFPRVEFDFPSIRKFTLEGGYIPDHLCIRSMSGYDQCWESHVKFSNTDVLTTAWFLRLSNFLKNDLRGSKIHLCLHLHSKKISDYEVGELDGLNVCEVEDLTLHTEDIPSLSCHVVLDALFRICRPKMITQYARSHGNKKYLFICRALERATQERSSLLMSTQFMYGLRDLEEIEVQQLIDEVWVQLPLGSVLAEAADSTSQTRFRLQLKWKPFAAMS